MPPPDAAEEAAKQRKMEPVKSFRKATHQVSGDDAAEGGRSYADRASEAEMRRASTDDGNPYEHLDPEGSTYVGARSSAGLPKPWKACPAVKMASRPSAVLCQGTSRDNITSSAVTSGRKRWV